MSKTAVIVVDLQADFTETEGGSLAVPGTDQVYIDTVIKATMEYAKQGLPIYATHDCHPDNHCSFAQNNPNTDLFDIIDIDGREQIMWPVHCVMDSAGARILLPEKLARHAVPKGMNRKFDSYSGFADDGGQKTGLEDLLQKQGVTKVIIYGLATDYCLKFTVLHALEAGFEVEVRLDLSRGVAPDTTRAAIADMKDKGAEVI